MTKEGNVMAVFGGQWGSEGKGVIVAHLADEYDVHVRVGAPNAGHSYKVDGKKYVHQSIPVGMKNPNAFLVIGRGAMINMERLSAELETFSKDYPGLEDRLFVDSRAGVISPWHQEEEGHTEGELHRRIGSTGEGVGVARRDRLMRDPNKFKLFGQVAGDYGLSHIVTENTSMFLDSLRRRGSNILLEGSQGFGLGLIHGHAWPYATSTECGVAQLAADVGIPPSVINQRLMVVRTYPIRVAGNSGPLPREITFEELSMRIGKEVTESTTVTKKTRRIAEWSWPVVEDAVRLNDPTSIALTFVDYICPHDEGKTNPRSLSMNTCKFADAITKKLNIPVRLFSTGGRDWSVAQIPDKSL